METAPIKRYRIRSPGRNVKRILAPIRGDGDPIHSKISCGFVGESVSVFFNESKPNKSLVVESLRMPLSFDLITGKIDCMFDHFYWFGIVGIFLVVFALAFGLLRIFLLY